MNTDATDRDEVVGTAQPTLLEQFVVEERRVFPLVVSGVVCLYSAVRMLPS